MAVTEEQKNWVELLKTHAERIGILAGFKDLQALHGEWIRKMLFCKDMYVLKAHRGSFKCLNPDTMVMMSDYSSKAIKDIEVGEYVMGWDGTPRKVIHKHSGRSPMYRVTLNKNGEYYECNNNHILSLYSKTPLMDLEKYLFKCYKSGYVYNVEIEDFLRLKEKKELKHFKVNKMFNEVYTFDFDIEPIVEGNFVGIAVEGDGMFLLDNFLVVHNTSVLEIVIALFIVLKPNCSIFFVRKTDDDVKEVIEKVQHLLKKDVFRVLTKAMHGVDLVLEKETAFAIDTNLNQHKEMVTAQLLGFGLKGSMTGKHCDILILDDICFVAGTKIATPFGDKNIEDLRVDDLVLTSTGYERVVKTTNRIADVITNVGLCGTPNHPVYSKATRDYKPLAEVTADEIVRLNDKQYECQSFSGKQTVYNIEVEHAHNYYANGILVHNCNTKDRESFAERELTKRVYFELNNNIKKKGGITIVTGTTWHVDDVFSVMPPAEIKTCYETGLLTEEQIQQLKDTMPPDLFAANYELRFVASGDCLFTTPKYIDDETLIYDGICHVDAGYGGNDYTAFCIVKKVPDEEKFIAFGKLWHRHVNDCIPEIENLIKKYRCGTLYLETNGDKGYLAKEFRHRKIRCVTYHERMNKHAKISTYLYKAWKNMVWLKSTDEKYIGQILDYTEMADHDDALECANLLRVLDRGKVQTIKGINL